MANFEKMLDLLEYMRAHLDKWDQSNWAYCRAWDNCGTTFCAAGFFGKMNGYEPVFSYSNEVTGQFEKDGDVRWIQAFASSELELTDLEAYALFIGSSSMTNIDNFSELAISILSGTLNDWVDDVGYQMGFDVKGYDNLVKDIAYSSN